MPNREDHMIGAFVLNIAYWILSNWFPSIDLFIGSSFGALIGGLFPDMIEPPTWPGHRGAWHYLGGPLALLLALVLMNKEPASFIGGAAFMGFVSHIIMDFLM